MTITDRVKNLLAFSKEARNSDAELHILYMQRAGMELTAKQIALIKELPSFETIRRIRQKLQESGEFIADEPVRKARQHKGLVVTQNAPTAKPERIEQILEDGRRIELPSGYKIAEEV